MKINVLIVEDEARIAGRIQRFTEEILQEQLGKLTVRNTLYAANDFLLHNEFDQMLLYLNLSGRDCFEFLQEVLAASFSTIVISAYRDKALEAFEYGVIDFVPKPFQKERLEKALSRALDQERKNEYAAKRIAIKKQGKIQFIDLESVLYFKGANVYTEIHLKNGRKELSDKSLNHLFQVTPIHFVRIHKSYIVNMLTAKQLLIHSGSKYELELNNQQFLPVGRTRYKEIKQQFFE